MVSGLSRLLVLVRRGKRPTVSFQQSAFSNQLSAVSFQQSAFSSQLSAVSNNHRGARRVFVLMADR